MNVMSKRVIEGAFVPNCMCICIIYYICTYFFIQFIMSVFGLYV